MTVVAIGSGLGNTASGSSLTSNATSGVSYTYRAAVNTQPSNLRVNGATSYTGSEVSLTWNAAVFSGSQTPTYSIRINGTQLTTTTSTSYTIPESTAKSYTSAVTITVVATGGGATSNATNSVTYTYSPSINGPTNLRINNATSYTGQTASLTWSAASISNGQAITYSIRKNNVEFATTTSTSYTVPSSVTSTWGSNAVTITVVAISGNLTSASSNSVTYTYAAGYKTVKYHNGTAWVECIAYYHDGTRWVKCDLYYHNGTKWNLSDH